MKKILFIIKKIFDRGDFLEKKDTIDSDISGIDFEFWNS